MYPAELRGHLNHLFTRMAKTAAEGAGPHHLSDDRPSPGPARLPLQTDADRAMESDLAQHLGGDRRQALQVAREAAHHCGVSIDEWLDMATDRLCDDVAGIAVMLLNRGSQKRSPELEGLIRALIDKIEQGELARCAHPPVGRLAERKVKSAMEIERDQMRETLIDLEHDVARAKNLARLLHMVVEHFADERDMLAISQLAGDLDETLETIEDARVSMIGALAPQEQTEQAAA
jgi:hypothetical protein